MRKMERERKREGKRESVREEERYQLLVNLRVGKTGIIVKMNLGAISALWPLFI